MITLLALGINLLLFGLLFLAGFNIWMLDQGAKASYDEEKNNAHTRDLHERNRIALGLVNE